VRYAVASRKNTDSLVKGMILLDEGGGKRGGGIKVFDENGAPVSPLSACFFWVLALGFFLVVSPAQKNLENWREIHPLDPLTKTVNTKRTFMYTLIKVVIDTAWRVHL